MLPGHTPCQIAYLVPDIRVAAERHARMFGTGPFYVVDNIQLKSCEYRGRPSKRSNACCTTTRTTRWICALRKS